ncbi:energy transducer TonB [Hymenobacter sp. YC55]|uniref:energy transducer TonB n=1 Tax=Hymenobacter sp. YC55 TaxID=3034019 RepID=UPI0023F6EE1E|nr:energy transducer TonB [Hymenobacter sp. YC55]MDF7814595.1 TonB family protein [Hymenobacter sp. YC55]
MTMPNLSTATLNDIVFEGRNKLYGAYVLRQLYERHLARALAIAISLTLLLVASPLIKEWMFPTLVEAVAPTPDLTQIIDILPPPTIAKPEPAGGRVKPVAPIVRPPAATAPKVVDDKLVKPDVKPVEPTVTTPELNIDADPGVIGNEGGTSTTAGPVGNDTAGSTTKAPPAPTIFLTAEVMPEFLGGQEALQRYMQKNLRYPSLALRNNIEGKVYISFTVMADGSVADVQVLKGLGYGTDEEAARVVKNMPAWKPGQQNKHAVSVRYTMPITFRYE